MRLTVSSGKAVQSREYFLKQHIRVCGLAELVKYANQTVGDMNALLSHMIMTLLNIPHCCKLVTICGPC